MEEEGTRWWRHEEADFRPCQESDVAVRQRRAFAFQPQREGRQGAERKENRTGVGAWSAAVGWPGGRRGTGHIPAPDVAMAERAQDVSQKQIAEGMGVSEATVSTRLRQGPARLKSIMGIRETRKIPVKNRASQPLLDCGGGD